MVSQEPALVVNRVSFRFPSHREDTLEDISFEVAPGERLGILGPNGGGKTTLLKLMLGLLRPDRGSIRVFGHTTTQATREGLIGYLPQRNQSELLAPLSVQQVVQMPVLATRRITSEDRAHNERMFDLLEIGDLRDETIGKLSGGQLQRVLIARALARRSKLLIMDEPTVGIDVSGQRRFADLMTRLHGELDLTTVMVSHELRTIVTGSTRIGCLARTMHFHGSASGLTPEILEQVFRHDVTGVLGDFGVSETGQACGGCCGEH